MILSCLGVLVMDRLTDGRMNEQTFVVVESLLRVCDGEDGGVSGAEGNGNVK